jgi:RNA polymerase sigma-70 factor (ECF subfamily)
MDEHAERAVVEGLRQGRAEAWQGLYDAYAERVWRCVARGLGARAADVADVVQDTLMAAARSVTTFDPQRGSLWAWLWGITRRHVALYLRKREQLDRLTQATFWLAAGNGRLLRWLDGHEPTPPEALAAAELASLVRAVLTELPDDYAFLLTAKYLDGDSVEAIARHEHSSETAVRSKLARARQAFRQAFARFADYPTEAPKEAHHEPT